ADGIIGTINLLPVGTGCSTIHVFTLGAPDNGDGNTGSYTTASVSNMAVPQTNIYGPDQTADQGGTTGCQPAGGPTNTPAPTNTPGGAATDTPTPGGAATNTPAATNTAGAATATVILQTVAASVRP